jgi:hypothetical protein
VHRSLRENRSKTKLPPSGAELPVRGNGALPEPTRTDRFALNEAMDVVDFVVAASSICPPIAALPRGVVDNRTRNV